jgi:hypothetical protein
MTKTVWGYSSRCRMGGVGGMGDVCDLGGVVNVVDFWDIVIVVGVVSVVGVVGCSAGGKQPTANGVRARVIRNWFMSIPLF